MIENNTAIKTARIVTHSNIVQCTDDGSSRYQLDHAEVRPIGPDSVFVAVTDGRALSVARVEGQASAAALVPVEAFSQTKSGGITKLVDDNWHTKGHRSNRETVTPHSKGVGRFPDLKSSIEADLDDCVTVTIDARLLVKIADAITNEQRRGVTLIIDKDKSEENPVHVDGASGFGVLMPMCRDKDRAGQQRANAIRSYKNQVTDYNDAGK